MMSRRLSSITDPAETGTGEMVTGKTAGVTGEAIADSVLTRNNLFQRLYTGRIYSCLFFTFLTGTVG